MRRNVVILFTLLVSIVSGQSEVRSFLVMDVKTAQVVSDCFILRGQDVYVTNDGGYFFLSINGESDTVYLSKFGYNDTCIVLKENSPTRIWISQRSILLLEAEVNSFSASLPTKIIREKVSKVSSYRKSLNQMGLVLGEEDIIKGLQFNSGVQGGNPGSSNIHVRGSSHYQNQLLLDGIPIFNINHLNGATSPLPSQGINQAMLYKQEVPVEYNGGSGSVVNLLPDKGLIQNVTGSIAAGLGTFSGNVFFPIGKDNTTIRISSRASTLGPVTYFNQLFSPDQSNALGFEDVLMSLESKIDSANQMNVIGYYSRDYNKSNTKSFSSQIGETGKSAYNAVFGFTYRTKLNQNSFISQKLYASHYSYNYIESFEEFSTSGKTLGSGNLDFDYGFSQYGYRSTFKEFSKDNRTTTFGFELAALNFDYPDIVEVILGENQENRNIDTSGPSYNTVEGAIFYEENLTIFDHLLFKAGLRVQVNSLRSGNAQFFLLPRLSISGDLTNEIGLFAAYDELTQPFHRQRQGVLTGAQDFAVAVSNDLPVERTRQFAIGGVYAKETFDLSVQGFYRMFNNLVDIDYDYPNYFETIGGLNNGELLYNPEVNLKSVNGVSYGVELAASISLGRLSSTSTYTWSKSFRQSPAFNQGRPYPYLFNRDHNFRMNATYKFKRSSIGKVVVLGVSWFYGTGLPTQFPFQYLPVPPLPGGIGDPGSIPIITDRNSAKLPDLHHLDLVISTVAESKKGTRTLTFSLFNVYLSRVVNTYLWVGNELNTEGVLPFVPSLSYKYRWK